MLMLLVIKTQYKKLNKNNIRYYYSHCQRDILYLFQARFMNQININHLKKTT